MKAERLTKKVVALDKKGAAPKIKTKTKQAICKLGKIEDYEELLQCDILPILKAMRNGIYICDKYCPYITINSKYGLIYYDKECCVRIRDYGVTWKERE